MPYSHSTLQFRLAALQVLQLILELYYKTGTCLHYFVYRRKVERILVKSLGGQPSLIEHINHCQIKDTAADLIRSLTETKISLGNHSMYFGYFS